MTYEQLVDLCRRERIHKGVTLVEIEKATGVSHSVLSRFENHPENKSIYGLMPYIECGIIIIYGATVNDK